MKRSRRTFSAEFKPAVDVYETYKSRMVIEVMFDGMKNVMKAD